MIVENVQAYCKEFRKNVLRLTLDEFCEKTGAKKSNISAFENGRANNLIYPSYYYDLASEYWKRRFLDDIYRNNAKEVKEVQRFSFE